MKSKAELTAEEAGMFAKHMKDPNFVKLFEEYAREISKPEAAADMNAYLTQLEAEGQAESVYGKGVQLIVPEPWFVVKTKDVSGAKRVYINICTSPKVDELKVITAAADGSGPRQQLQLPMVLHGKDGKQGTAPDGGPLLVWDLAVNPNAVQHANSSRQALETLVIMAIERVEQALGSKLLHEYKLPKLKYKATPAAAQPGVMAARTAEGGDVVDGRLRPLTEATAAAASSPAPSARPGSSTSSRSGFSFSKAQPATAATAAGLQQQPATAVPSNPATAGYKHACGAVTPSWKLVERHTRADVQQTWRDTGRGLQADSNAPQELVVSLQLPGIESCAAVQLDVSSQELHVHVPGKYLLALGPAQLRYSLLPDKGSARFDKTKQQLKVTVAVDQPPQQQQSAKSAVAELVEHPELQQESCGEEQPEDQQQQQAVATGQAADDVQEESRTAESGTAVDATVVVTRKPSSDQAAGKTFSQAQWDEVHQTLDKQLQQEQQQQQQLEQQHLAGGSKAGIKDAHQQPSPAFVKPRLLSRRLNALTDLD